MSSSPILANAGLVSQMTVRATNDDGANRTTCTPERFFQPEGKTVYSVRHLDPIGSSFEDFNRTGPTHGGGPVRFYSVTFACTSAAW